MTSRTMDGCIRCGACVRACPVLAQEGREAFPGPRRLVIEAPRFDPHLKALKGALYMCTTCGRCEEVCPSRLPLPAALVRMRSIVLEGADRPAGQLRMIRAIEDSGRAVVPPSSAQSYPSEGDLVFFPGCIAEGRLPGSVAAALRLLEASGARPYVPSAWSCCGSPLEKIGATDQLRKVEANNKAVLKTSRLVTACPGCTAQLRAAYGKDAWHIIEHLHAAKISEERFDTSAPPMKIALHRPCHLARVVGPHTIDMVKDILESVPGVKVIEHRDQDDCCGGGGGVAASRPEVAEKMARRKLRSAKDAGADIMIAPCPFCVVNLGRVGTMPVEDLTTFLAGRLDPGQN